MTYQNRYLPREDLFTSLLRGQKTVITYEFRLFHKTRGILSLLGDKMITERKIEYTVSTDTFGSGYLLETTGGQERYENIDALLERVEKIRIELNRNEKVKLNELYARIRTTLVHRKLAAPFTLLEPFLQNNRIRGKWKEYRFHTSDGED